MKTIKFVLALSVIFGILCGFAACAWADQYPRIFLVEAIDLNSDTVTFSDVNGQLWNWIGIEDWIVDDMAAAIMDDNGTPSTIYDDIIVKLYYQTNITNWFEPDEVWED